MNWNFIKRWKNKLTHTCLKLKLYPGRNELTYTWRIPCQEQQPAWILASRSYGKLGIRGTFAAVNIHQHLVNSGTHQDVLCDEYKILLWKVYTTVGTSESEKWYPVHLHSCFKQMWVSCCRSHWIFFCDYTLKTYVEETRYERWILEISI